MKIPKYFEKPLYCIDTDSCIWNFIKDWGDKK